MVKELTGSPSQIFCKLPATGLGGPLYIANASGIIVGSTGSIAAPSQGVGLLAYPLDSSTFDGTVSIGKGATGGDVTVEGAKISGGSLLVAGAGNVNVSVNMSCTSSCGVYSLSGVPFTTGPNSVVPTSITLPKPPPPPHHHHWW